MSSLCRPLVQFAQTTVSNQIQQVKFDLDYWAANQTNQLLRRCGKVRHRAWEYTTPGSLSPGGPGAGCRRAEALISTNIQKARFNVYVVLSDGSLGVHNPQYYAGGPSWIPPRTGSRRNGPVEQRVYDQSNLNISQGRPKSTPGRWR
jgi:hypothetical protein